MRFFTKGMSLVAIDTEFWSLHFGVHPDHWVWGRDTEEYDGVLEYVGFGPIFLLSCDAKWWWS